MHIIHESMVNLFIFFLSFTFLEFIVDKLLLILYLKQSVRLGLFLKGFSMPVFAIRRMVHEQGKIANMSGMEKSLKASETYGVNM